MKIETVYTLKQPLSHIGENESTTSFLNTINIVSNGKVEEIFALTGNAIRGTLRDCAARYLLNRLNIKLHKKEFNILFSGGNISDSLTTDIDQAKKWRALCPLISIFGAGVGNQILQGKLTQTFALPICSETQELLSEKLIYAGYINNNLLDISWKKQTDTINFTRFDDIKSANIHNYIEPETEEKKAKNNNSASQQMRYEVEYYLAGGQLYHLFNFFPENNIEYGCFLSALYEFAKNPYIGGMGGKGFGLVDVTYFSGDNIIAEILEQEFKIDANIEKILNDYDNFLIETKKEITEFLNGVEK